MPRYDYRCEDCGGEFELKQTFAEAGKGICPECEGNGRRIFHSVPVIYKGSGFYTTDYGRPKAPVDSQPKSQPKKEETSTSTSNESGETSKTASSSKDSSTTSNSSTTPKSE
ncbi:MAG TPA: FmdB family transcriptional regulator [Dehalococcoidia bacterium]|jgi:putative FmdB family regulatory protein|nr:FmdB family transcriptional regulator [Dehalococcoidia bacterium]|tara:strand:+ start:49 stop:384 length:336 start_codon:yes stop_codon:yes gene_type:complete